MTPDSVFEIPDTASVTLDDLNDILITAVEGGVGYWAEIRNYRWENQPMVSVEVRESYQRSAEKPGWHKITSVDLLPILPKIKDHSGQAKSWNIREIVEQCDADIADIAVQILIFGEVVYG